MELNSCPLCNDQNASITPYGNRDAWRVKCRRCGHYGISRPVAINVKGEPALLPYLSMHTRQADESGTPVDLHTDTYEALARSHQQVSVTQKNRRLLEVLSRKTRVPGEAVLFEPRVDHPLIDAVDERECVFFLRHAREMNYITGQEPKITVAVRGWQFLEPPTGASGIPGRCFVAMWFDARMDEAFDLGIKPAIQDCGFPCPMRIDRKQHNEKIDDEILAEIRSAQFVVADVTGHRQGVYFEAGYAKGLGKPVIWTCLKDDFEHAHFDTRQYYHLVWQTPEDLRQQLRNRVLATIPS